MQTLAKTVVGTVAAGAMAVSVATPALARDHGISTGDVIAGALVVGGIAAVAAAASNDDGYRYGNDYRWDDRGRWGDDGRRGSSRYGSDPRGAVEQCVRTAERTASRYSYGSRADVTDIRNVERTRYGYKVTGRIAVNSMGRDWRYGDRRYGSGWGSDYRGWNDGLRGYDAGRFTCKVDYRGRVADLDFSGIRGL